MTTTTAADHDHDPGNGEACRAITAILRSLANGDIQALADDAAISIPGLDTPDKKELEAELKALVCRVRQLEARAASTNHQTLPETPNEFAPPASPFSLASPAADGISNASKNGASAGSPASSDAQAAQAAQADQSNQSQLEYLQSKCKSHEMEILANRKKLRDLLQETERVKAVPQVTIHEATKIDRLQRELKKSQQANEAFSKALREIGEIVTAGKPSIAPQDHPANPRQLREAT